MGSNGPPPLAFAIEGKNRHWGEKAFALDQVELTVGHPYDVEHATRLHVEWCVALIERTGLTTTHQTEPEMRALMLELRRSLEPAAVLGIANAWPALERGVFLDGWSLDYTPDPPTGSGQFYERVYGR